MPDDHTAITNDAAVIRRLKRRYRVQDALFWAFDAARTVVSAHGGRSPALPFTPARVLVANAGHVGDMIMSTASIAALKAALPGVEIGVLTGTYNRPVLENHPLVGRLHFLDHWYLSRDRAPLRRKAVQYRHQRARVVREIADCGYDAAVDLRIWFPNFISVLADAGIPLRIAYDRVGGGPLLTHRKTCRYDRRHELERQMDLVSELGVSAEAFRRARPTLAPIPNSAAAEVDALVGGLERFRILHPAASVATKDWPLASWLALGRALLKEGITPVITGRGARDAAIARAIADGLPGCINSCDRLSWGGLMEMIRRADLVYSVDTAIAHIAAALQRPTVTISGGMADPSHWKPYGAHAVVATNRLSCHPCFRKSGCAHRACLTGLPVEDVQSAARAAQDAMHAPSWAMGDISGGPMPADAAKLGGNARIHGGAP
jgi:ADP-heptose:LPS heptosyltransferase